MSQSSYWTNTAKSGTYAPVGGAHRTYRVTGLPGTKDSLFGLKETCAARADPPG